MNRLLSNRAFLWQTFQAVEVKRSLFNRPPSPPFGVPGVPVVRLLCHVPPGGARWVCRGRPHPCLEGRQHGIWCPRRNQASSVRASGHLPKSSGHLRHTCGRYVTGWVAPLPQESRTGTVVPTPAASPSLSPCWHPQPPWAQLPGSTAGHVPST